MNSRKWGAWGSLWSRDQVRPSLFPCCRGVGSWLAAWWVWGDVWDRPGGPVWSGPAYLAILPFMPSPSPIIVLQTHRPSHSFLTRLGFLCQRLLLCPLKHLEHKTAVFWAFRLTLLSLSQGRYSSFLVAFCTFAAPGTVALKSLTVLLVGLCVPVSPTMRPKSSWASYLLLVHYGVPAALLMAHELFMDWINKCMS